MFSEHIRKSVRARIGCALFCAVAAINTAAAQSVTTDRDDYDPGDTVLIAGNGFHADEVVTLQVYDVEEGPGDPSNGHLPWHVVADSNGAFSSSWYVEPDDSFGEVLILTADCSHGLHAETYFTDALGTARIASVVGLGGACVQLTTIGAGPNAEQFWELERSKSYIVTLTNVSECFSTTIQVVVDSGNVADQCLTATNNGPSQYSFVLTTTDDACRLYTISYCTSSCSPLTGRVARQPNGTNLHIGHLRAVRFGPNCANPVTIGEFECCPDPQISCPAATVVCNDTDACCAAVTFSPTVTGGCPPVSVVSTPPSGFCFPIGLTQVTSVATDVNGRTAQCTFDVTVNDCEDPVINCPPDITVCNDTGQCCAIVDLTAYVTASDNCGALLSFTPASGSCFPVGTTPVLCTATDPSGRTATCTVNVVVNDCEVPTITCPADITQCNDPGECSAVVTFADPITSDNCGVSSVVCNPVSGSTFAVGTTPVVCTVTDSAGLTAQCTFNVTVNDCEDPHVTCPANITQCNDPGQCSAVVTFADPSATDNCGVSSIVCAPPSGSTFSVGTSMVVCTVTDGAGNTAQCTFNVTVNDCEDPHITCPGDLMRCNDAGQCAAVVTFADPAATDNCGVSSVVCNPPSGSTFPVGTTQVVSTATDAAGNTAQCTFNVIVTDCEDPTISCPAPITQCNDSGQCCAVVTFSVGASDNCSGVTVVSTPPSGTCFPIGQTTVTSVATDGAGRTAVCSFTVTVSDCEDPSLTCPDDQLYGTDPGQCCAVVNFTVPAFDNCPGVAVTSVPPPGTCFAVGATQVTSTATDAAGRTAQCTFNIVVHDFEPPTIQCPPNFIETWTVGPPSQVNPSHTGTPTYSDNCTATLTYSDVFHPGLHPGEPETIVTRTWTVTDGRGNTASCVQTITLLSPGNHGGLHLDAMPGSCPNTLHVWNGGMVPCALIGSFQFDVGQVVPNSLRIRRADGQGRQLHGKHAAYLDAATPFHGVIGGCHTYTSDGSMDLSFDETIGHFRRAFGLAPMAEGTQVEIMVTGMLYNGDVFEAHDFVTISQLP